MPDCKDMVVEKKDSMMVASKVPQSTIFNGDGVSL
jgi:hypothetical protein